MTKLTYIKHRFGAKHTKGFNVHSPFMFHFINSIIYEKHPYYAFAEIEKIRNELLKNKNTISCIDPENGENKQFSIASYTKQASLPPKYDQLLFRIAHAIHAKNIVEFGTVFGLSSLYMTATRSDSNSYIFENNKEIADLTPNRNGRIQLITSDLSKNAKAQISRMNAIDLIYIEKNLYQEMLEDVFLCLEKSHDGSIAVVKNIHQSATMRMIWEKLISDPKSTSAIDAYRVGIVFFKKILNKQLYKIRF